METTDLLTPQDATRELAISRVSIYAAIRENRLASVRVLGRLAVRRADIESYRRQSQPNRVPSRGRPRKK